MAVEISDKQLVASYQKFFGNFYPHKNDTIFKKFIIKTLQFCSLNSKNFKLKKISFIKTKKNTS